MVIITLFDTNKVKRFAVNPIVSGFTIVVTSTYCFYTAYANVAGFNLYLYSFALSYLIFCILFFLYFRKFKNALLMLSIPFILTIFSHFGVLDDLSYEGFLQAHQPISAFMNHCVFVTYSDEKHQKIGFCQKLDAVDSELPQDIIYDSGGWIAKSPNGRPMSWTLAFETLSNIAQGSQLYQIAQIEDLDAIRFRGHEIGGHFFVVSYLVNGF